MDAPALRTSLLAATLLGWASGVTAGDDIVTVQPQEPAKAVWLLSAPHIGDRICEVPASTPIRFIAPARHGSHRYARVEVLEGACAGEEGYVPASTLESGPQ